MILDAQNLHTLSQSRVSLDAISCLLTCRTREVSFVQFVELPLFRALCCLFWLCCSVSLND